MSRVNNIANRAAARAEPSRQALVNAPKTQTTKAAGLKTADGIDPSPQPSDVIASSLDMNASPSSGASPFASLAALAQAKVKPLVVDNNLSIGCVQCEPI